MTGGNERTDATRRLRIGEYDNGLQRERRWGLEGRRRGNSVGEDGVDTRESEQRGAPTLLQVLGDGRGASGARSLVLAGTSLSVAARSASRRPPPAGAPLIISSAPQSQ
jgi:hypothetical protein